LYEVLPDPYCYPGTTVLKNRLNIRDAAALEQFEAASTMERGAEPLPNGRFGTAHYRAIHHHLFQDVYAWAGKYRTVRMARGGNPFCYPENIPPQMDAAFAELKAQQFLRDLNSEEFAQKCAAFLATLNAIHPFRDGNGRSQLAFVTILAARAGHILNLDRLVPDAFLNAMIVSFDGDEGPLANQILALSTGGA
jgi:cell filamentation protein